MTKQHTSLVVGARLHPSDELPNIVSSKTKSKKQKLTYKGPAVQPNVLGSREFQNYPLNLQVGSFVGNNEGPQAQSKTSLQESDLKQAALKDT